MKQKTEQTMQPRFTQAHLTDLFKAAIETFFRKETENILSGVSEPSLCGRLAIYLETSFPAHRIEGNYHADVECNRKQNGEVKTIIDDNERVVRISSDLLLHSRGREKPDNLITVEMKKSGRSAKSKKNDRMRLRAMTKKTGVWAWNGSDPEHVSGYILGFYIELDNSRRLCTFEKYKGGDMIASWTQAY